MHKAAFLGPKGENAVELERLLLEVLHDHVFWRRNFHPSDDRLIEERDKQTEAYGQMVARLRDELFQILAELKRGAPLYSPRQIGHMVSDPTLPALVGYFAGLLYNQNNVVAEAAPETVRKERAYLAALARMIAYPPMLPAVLTPEARRARAPYAWGHLCSGGTLANLEALWVARNVRFFPLALKLMAATTTSFDDLARVEVGLPGGARRALAALSTFEAANVPVAEILGLHRQLMERLGSVDRARAAAFEAALPSVRRRGLAAFLHDYNAAFPGDPFRPPRVLISQAAHYGWAKAMDIVGLGADALLPVPVDAHIRVDVGALEETIRACAARQEPVLMVVSICGTTEEGAVDPLHRVEALRDGVAGAGVAFWHHSDAAFGGYFASMVPKDEAGRFVPYEARPAEGAGAALLSEEVYRAVTALSATDSVTVDPHKLGYIPYPAGAVLFRDYNARDAISYAAPYLATEATAGYSGFLGQWTLEGSRPGAAAVSCYLSEAAVPLTEEAHGRLMANCVAATRSLVAALHDRFDGDDAWVALRPFTAPDTVGFCFVLVPHGEVRSVAHLNGFTERIWRRMTVDGREDINQYAFLLSKTDVSVEGYRHVLAGLLPEVDLAASPDAAAPGGAAASLTLLRLFVMNPFAHDWNERTPAFSARFSRYLHDVAAEVYPEHVLSTYRQQHGGRLQVLVVEHETAPETSVAHQIQFHPAYAAYLDVQAVHDPRAVAGGPAPWQWVVVVDAGAEDVQATVRHLVGERGTAPGHILVWRAGAAPEGARRTASALGLPPGHVLAADGRDEGLQVLMRRLCAHL